MATLDEMHRELNPFSPGAGRRPPQFVGRDGEIDRFDRLIALSRRNRVGRPIAIHGLRGVGKTVLLRAFRAQAERAGWLTIALEASTSSEPGSDRIRLGRDLLAIAHRLERGGPGPMMQRAVGTIKSFSVGIPGIAQLTFGEGPTTGRADSGRLDVDFEDLIDDVGPILRDRSSALAVFVDEMQDLESDLTAALVTAQHRASQTDVPFYVVGAGLPSLPARLATARSYAERMFDQHAIGALSREHAVMAIREPALRLGMTFDPAAELEIVSAANGYPFFLQLFAEKAWDAAADRRITVADAELGVRLGLAELDDGFFPARWDRSTGLERRYLAAIAELGQSDASTSSLAAQLALPASSLTSTRRSLIEKGVLYAPERGRVAFTVPGMAEYIARRAAEDE